MKACSRIGLIIYDFIAEHSQEYIEGASRFCKKNDCTLYVFPLGEPRETHNPYTMQLRALIKLVSAQNLDGLIIASTTQCNYITRHELYAFVQSFAPLPTVSIGYAVPDVPSIITDEKQGFRSLVEHLINKHACKRIGFLGTRTKSAEAKAREEIFRSVLTNNGIAIDESLFMYGDFSYASARDALTVYIREHGRIDFDALVCANDNMAFGSIDFLQELNTNNNNIIVTGYDDVSRASFSRPSLSTVSTNLVQQGYIAANLVSRMIQRESVSTLITVSTRAVLRQSCGCVPLSNMQPTALDENGDRMPDEHVDGTVLASEWYVKRLQIVRFAAYQTDAQMNMPLSKLRLRLARDIADFDISAAAVCLYTQPVYEEKGVPFVMPDSAYVFVAFDKANGVNIGSDVASDAAPRDIVFDPNECMLPTGILTDTPSTMLVVPLFHLTTQFGYMVFRCGNFDFAIYRLFLNSLASAIAVSFEYSKNLLQTQSLSESNDELRKMSVTDELTHLLNRRGFWTLGQQTIDITVDMGNDGVVAFCDMDGLKQINDTYGHEAGDRAIRGEAEVLKQLFRSTDIVARLGGDEFCVVAPGMKKASVTRLYSRLEKLLSKWNASSNEPFTLSISLGFAFFSIDNSDLVKVLKQADTRQYTEKRKKKNALKAAPNK